LIETITKFILKIQMVVGKNENLMETITEFILKIQMVQLQTIDQNQHLN